ncbi:MAG TPA: TIGR03087 family PEP-CTERM/XrtA system glycosyltransferase [Burkholderiaceae bacterium]|nr:TIGR03087 family PEP-CTERM/XrtA system glycosyltransferase [Burkholderiaceae bacterium]
MEPLLYLVHRIPFPPNKGDKIRSYHLLRHLARRFAVHLGTFVDMPEDEAHVHQLESMCASHRVETIDPRLARLRSVSGFLTGEALTLPYYRNSALQAWVRSAVAQYGIRKAVVFSAAMAQYVQDLPQVRFVLDLVDVDSAKWAEYAERHSWPTSYVYRREGEKLLKFERCAAERAAANVFVTRGEADIFRRRVPGFERQVHVIENGVNTDYFAPHAERTSPYAANEAPIVFTGAMDYWPNVDAVIWFASEVLPPVLAERPDARFYVVGMNPTPTVTALATRPGVVVTGTVSDVRPYVQHAAAVVAPLRVARGIQNKVLEAMALARPVVVSSAAAQGVSGVPGCEFEVAETAPEFARKVCAVLDRERGVALGRAGRARILADYSWERNLSAFDRLLDGAPPLASSAVR